MRSPTGTRASRRLLAALALGCAVVLAVAGMALARAKPGSYAGLTKQNQAAFNFEVSANGTKLRHIEMTYLPTFCPGGPDAAYVKFKTAEIRHNRFKAAGKQYGFDDQVTGTATMAGRFISKKKEQGTLETNFPGFGGCGGTTTQEARRLNLPG